MDDWKKCVAKVSVILIGGPLIGFAMIVILTGYPPPLILTAPVPLGLLGVLVLVLAD